MKERNTVREKDKDEEDRAEKQLKFLQSYCFSAVTLLISSNGSFSCSFFDLFFHH